MIKINIENLKLQFEKDNFEYSIERKYNELILMRIDKTNKKTKKDKRVIVVDIELFNVSMYGFKNNIEKDEVINDIILNLKNNKMAEDICDIDELEKVIKSSYINVLISNCNVGLSNSSIKNIRGENFKLDIVLDSSNAIIGYIECVNGVINVQVEECYKKESLMMFSNLMMLLFKSGYIKDLKNNS